MYRVSGQDATQETEGGCCLLSLHILCGILTTHPVLYVFSGHTFLQFRYPDPDPDVIIEHAKKVNVYGEVVRFFSHFPVHILGIVHAVRFSERM